MIYNWYVGFIGDNPERKRAWFDIFTCKDFRHVMVMGYDASAKVWVVYDTNIGGSDISVYKENDLFVSEIISYVSKNGKWLRFKKGKQKFYTGCWRLYCVTAVKFLLSFKSSALRPKALYRDLVKAGAQHVFYKGT